MAGTVLTNGPLMLGSLTGPQILQGAADPSAGAGVAAPAGSIYLRTNGSVYWKAGAGDTQWTVIGGSGAGDVEFVTSTQAGESDATSGIEFIPLIDANDAVEFQFVAPSSGNFAIRAAYVMSAANGGSVECRLDFRAVADGVDPFAALTAGAAFTFAPGNDVAKHRITEATSAELVVAAGAGDLVRCKLLRTKGAADTHPGDMRILGISWAPE